MLGGSTLALLRSRSMELTRCGSDSSSVVRPGAAPRRTFGGKVRSWEDALKVEIDRCVREGEHHIAGAELGGRAMRRPHELRRALFDEIADQRPGPREETQHAQSPSMGKSREVDARNRAS